MKVEMEIIRKQSYQTRALGKPVTMMFDEPAATYLEERGIARRVVVQEAAAEPRRRGRRRKGNEEAAG